MREWKSDSLYCHAHINIADVVNLSQPSRRQTFLVRGSLCLNFAWAVARACGFVSPNVLWSLWTICAVRRRSEGHTPDMSRANSFTDDIDLGAEESPLPAASDVAQWVSSSIWLITYMLIDNEGHLTLSETCSSAGWLHLKWLRVWFLFN